MTRSDGYGTERDWAFFNSLNLGTVLCLLAQLWLPSGSPASAEPVRDSSSVLTGVVDGKQIRAIVSPDTPLTTVAHSLRPEAPNNALIRIGELRLGALVFGSPLVTVSRFRPLYDADPAVNVIVGNDLLAGNKLCVWLQPTRSLKLLQNRPPLPSGKVTQLPFQLVTRAGESRDAHPESDVEAYFAVISVQTRNTGFLKLLLNLQRPAAVTLTETFLAAHPGIPEEIEILVGDEFVPARWERREMDTYAWDGWDGFHDGDLGYDFLKNFSQVLVDYQSNQLVLVR